MKTIILIATGTFFGVLVTAWFVAQTIKDD